MAKESQGVVCYWSTTTAAATAAGNLIGEVVGFSGPSLTAAVIDVTNLASTAKEKMVGVYDGGQVTLNVNWNCSDASGQSKMRKTLMSRVKGHMVLGLNGAAGTQKIGLKGYVSGMNITGSVDNKLSGDYTLAISGGASFTS
jgi:hypothetical protein